MIDPIHSLPSPRFILVHSHDSTLDANQLDRRGHAFGPFEDYEALAEFDAKMPKDSCYRFAIPLVGPERRDMALTALGIRLGARPGSMPLPARQADGETSTGAMAGLMTALRDHMEQARKEERKREKKAAKKEAKQRAIDEANAADDGR